MDFKIARTNHELWKDQKSNLDTVVLKIITPLPNLTEIFEHSKSCYFFSYISILDSQFLIM